MSERTQQPIDRFLEMQKVRLERRFVKATVAQSKEIYGDEHVVTFDEELMIDTPGAQRRKQYIQFYEAIRTGSVMRGKITSCYVDEATNIVSVAIVQDSFKVIIPLPFLMKISDEQIEKEREQSAVKQLNFLMMCGHMRVGSIIDYVPCQIDEYRGVVIASRLMAMDIRKRQNYLPYGGNKEPLVKTGMIVQARVCYTKKSSMCVEIGGVEAVMRQIDISYLRIQDVQTLYKPGDYVPVRILDVEFVRDEERKIKDVKVMANIKDAVRNPQKDNFNNYSIGESVRGSVVQRTADGIFVRIENTECDVMCSPEKDVVESDKADSGDIVLIKIIEKDETTYRIKGVIKWNYSKNIF